MRFLTNQECQEAARTVGLDPSIVATMRLLIPQMAGAAMFPYRSRLDNAGVVARALVEWLGPITWSVLWVFGLPWGDRSLEDIPPADWRRYAVWRRAGGDGRSIAEAPGFAFAAAEAATAEAVKLAIDRGWDAALLAQPSRCLIRFSHDDFIECLSHSQAALGTVTEALGELGLSPAP